MRKSAPSSKRKAAVDVTRMAQTRIGPHTADSLDDIAGLLEAAAETIRSAAKILRISRSDAIIDVLGAKGMWGSKSHPGAIPKAQSFAADSMKKANQVAADVQRERRRQRR